MTDAVPLILTALMERSAFARFDALRRAHFPPERNLLGAHITMFHHLPGPQSAEIVRELKDAARHETRMAARASRLHFMGRGSSIIVDSEALSEFRARLAANWAPLLVPQDSQGWRPHVTVQNKGEGKAAKALYNRLSDEFTPWPFIIEGVSLWWYRGGPWEKLRDIRFPA
ncbi:2'-5' RNA ligase family protein [Pacificimonas sp. WHA3]|uniref:2'-5' RNA ligase family protein n=1 Tax=Pacificimonas pallii TaxID=2827236 RepID=A0ABS6SEP2_9SPHN|nr:2'-5' RNA ligase family protein [Pacificimonas pallii]MBV7256844.1 2'-5' RNA ligase family protein [Pacificimonas pallii]